MKLTGKFVPAHELLSTGNPYGTAPSVIEVGAVSLLDQIRKKPKPGILSSIEGHTIFTPAIASDDLCHLVRIEAESLLVANTALFRRCPDIDLALKIGRLNELRK